MFLLSVTQHFRGSILLILRNMQYFRGWILLILCNAQYFRRVDVVYTKRDAVFSGVDTSYTKQYAVFSGVVNVILNNKHYFPHLGTAYTDNAVFSYGRSCLYSVFDGLYCLY